MIHPVQSTRNNLSPKQGDCRMLKLNLYSHIIIPRIENVHKVGIWESTITYPELFFSGGDLLHTYYTDVFCYQVSYCDAAGFASEFLPVMI